MTDEVEAPPPPPPACTTCGRELDPGDSSPCIRCQYAQQHAGRDYDTDAAEALRRGIRLSTYVREQLEG